MNPSWTMHNIKLDAVDEKRPANCKVLMQRDRISWLVKVSAFWSGNFDGELWIVGDGARHLLDIKCNGGIFSASKKLNAASWDNFIYKAKNIVITSGGKLCMNGKMPQRKPLNSIGIMSLIIAENRGRKIAEKLKEAKNEETKEEFFHEGLFNESAPKEPVPEQQKPEEPKPQSLAAKDLGTNDQEPEPTTAKEPESTALKEPEFQNENVTLPTFQTPLSEEEEKMERIKSILRRPPVERIQPPVKRFGEPEDAGNFEPDQKADIIPISWDTNKIEEALSTKPLAMPFAGNYAGSKFVRVDVSEAQGYDHVIVGKVPLEKMPVYMLCVPGAATRPPASLPEFNRWIPGRTGNGYWVKYITS